MINNTNNTNNTDLSLENKNSNSVYDKLVNADFSYLEKLNDKDFRVLREKQHVKISDMETSAMHLISTMGTIPVETFFKLIKMYYPNSTLDEVLYVLDKNSNQGNIYLLYDDDSSCIADTSKYEELRYGEDEE